LFGYVQLGCRGNNILNLQQLGLIFLIGPAEDWWTQNAFDAGVLILLIEVILHSTTYLVCSSVLQLSSYQCR